MKTAFLLSIIPVVQSFGSYSLFKEWQKVTEYEINHFIETDEEMFERWLANDEMIQEHNAGNHSWKMEHNQFSHFKPEEFAAMYLGHLHPIKPMMLNAFRDRYFLNESGQREDLVVNWITKGVVGAVRNQAKCGSCWAHATIETVESLYALETGNLVNMSVQQLVSCDHTDGNAGCQGGLMEPAFSYVAANGLYSEEAYPYTSQDGEDGECLQPQNQTLILEKGWLKGFKDIPHHREDLLRLAITKQPVAIAVDATYFQFYSSGVYSSRFCSKEKLNHAVVLTGYDMDEGYYWLRNSWSEAWGMSGYMKIAMDKNECGLAMSASIPTH